MVEAWYQGICGLPDEVNFRTEVVIMTGSQDRRIQTLRCDLKCEERLPTQRQCTSQEFHCKTTEEGKKGTNTNLVNSLLQKKSNNR